MMTKENGVKQLTDMVADFVGHIGKKLPDDVVQNWKNLVPRKQQHFQRFCMKL